DALTRTQFAAALEKTGRKLRQVPWVAPSEHRTNTQLAFNLACADGQDRMTVYGLARLNETVNRSQTWTPRKPRRRAVAAGTRLGWSDLGDTTNTVSAS